MGGPLGLILGTVLLACAFAELHAPCPMPKRDLHSVTGGHAGLSPGHTATVTCITMPLSVSTSSLLLSSARAAEVTQLLDVVPEPGGALTVYRAQRVKSYVMSVHSIHYSCNIAHNNTLHPLLGEHTTHSIHYCCNIAHNTLHPLCSPAS